MKNKIFVTDYSLDSGREYTLSELDGIAQKRISEFIKYYLHNDNMALINHYSISSEIEYNYGERDGHCAFKMSFYRDETDKEYKTRLEQEATKLIREKEQFDKRNKAAAEKLMKKQALEQDPEYQKFLELKDKFKI